MKIRFTAQDRSPVRWYVSVHIFFENEVTGE